MSNTTITAKGKLHGHDIDAECINPGDWFGKTWLIEIGCGFSPFFYAVEADTVTDAIDEFSGSKHGHHIVVEDADLDDYPEGSRYYNDGGQVCDLDNVMIHGEERPGRRNDHTPWPCRYYGEGLPEAGMTPLEYYRRDDEPDEE